MTTAKSTFVSNLDNVPVIKNDRVAAGAPVLTAFVTAEGQSVTSGAALRMFRLPSRAVLFRLEMATDDLGASSDPDVGLYYAINNPASPTGAVIDADLFASAVDTSGQAYARTDITDESGVVAIENRGKQLWARAGLSSDPGGDFDICLTPGATITATVALWVSFVLADA